jgi:two-component system cell cycle sensor histidine kinase/response regulator CckA
MPSHVAMNANTAMGLATAAAALWLLCGQATSAWRRRVALGCSLAVAALGGVTLVEYLIGTGFGIDQLLGPGPSVEFNTTNPGRMAPETALNLTLVGTALCWMARPRLVLAAQALTVVVAMLGLFNLVGYVYGAVSFYKLDHKSSIGIVTAVAFVLLGAGMLLARPNDGLIPSITSGLPGGVVIRRLLLAVLVLPLVLGWLELVGEHEGLFNQAQGTGIAGVAGSLALVMLIWRTARVLDRSGQGRRKAEELLHHSNELLKQSVRERTVLLANANQSLNRGVSEREHMEELLRLQASALESAANSIVITDRTGVIEWVNPAFCVLTGYSTDESIGHSLQKLENSGRHDESFYKGVWSTILSGQVWRSEVVNRRKDGSNFTVFQTITPVRDKRGSISHFVAIEEDITEKKQLEEQALRAQRVQNLGLLAAGIAHDFNNALAPIAMAAPLLRPQVGTPSGQRMLDIIEQCSERGASLVRRMLSFARGTLDRKVQVQVRDVLREVIEIAKTTFPKSIRIESDLPGDLWPVTGDPTQINQIFMNLFINARDAMAQGGEIVITAANRTLNAPDAAGISDARPGRFLAVEVRDNGTGIPPEVLQRIWEPFFTTKGLGKGTGLGLSTVRAIVRQHDGFVAVQTHPKGAVDSGTSFTVYLPAVAVQSTVDLVTNATGEPAGRGEGELILVVDDEAAVLEVIEKILIRQGYRVVTATDGAEAISAFGSRASEVRLLLTDSDMPIVGGKALIAALRRQNPDLPVVMISGAENQLDEAFGLSAVTWLAKPFATETLMVTVCRALSEARSASPCLAET